MRVSVLAKARTVTRKTANSVRAAAAPMGARNFGNVLVTGDGAAVGADRDTGRRGVIAKLPAGT